MIDSITSQKSFNYPAVNRQLVHPMTYTAFNFFFNCIGNAMRDGVIVNHWMGTPKPWSVWVSNMDVLPITV
jgi:hypothetical protein